MTTEGSRQLTHRLAGEHQYENMWLPCDYPAANLDKVPDFSLDQDVLLASYPKTGSTWMSELLWLLMNDGDLEAAKTKTLLDRVNVLEVTADYMNSLEVLQNADHPRVIKSHLPARFFTNQLLKDDLKVIVTIRNPKDALVSLYNHYKMNDVLGFFEGSWNDFFELVKQKHVFMGDYFDWYMEWAKYQNHSKVKVIHYEDMKRDLISCIKDISEFLGITINKERLADVIDHLSFQKMRNNDMTNYSYLTGMKQEISPFMRRGVVGDWKNYFTEEQSSYIDVRYRDTIFKQGLLVQYE